MKINTEKTIRVAIYARVANGEQIDIDRKIRVCSEYIEHIPNHTIVAKYTDLNKSGRNISDRSGFQQMLFDAKNGMFDLIVVCELNDFSRNVSDVIYRMHDLKGMGITVYFISDNIRTDNPDDELMEYFSNELSKGVVVYSHDGIQAEARSRVEALSDKERASLIESIANAKAEKCIRDVIQRNFRKVQADVKGIIEKECWQPQDMTPVGRESADPRMVDPFA